MSLGVIETETSNSEEKNEKGPPTPEGGQGCYWGRKAVLVWLWQASVWDQVWFRAVFSGALFAQSLPIFGDSSQSVLRQETGERCFSLLGMQFSAKVAKGMFQPGISTNEASWRILVIFRNFTELWKEEMSMHIPNSSPPSISLCFSHSRDQTLNLYVLGKHCTLLSHIPKHLFF